MNLLESIIAVVLVILILMTFATEPKLSFNYFKAVVKSGFVAFSKTKDFIQSFKEGNIEEDDVGWRNL